MVKKRVSIKDIAELAGVSHPTVSRALRGHGRMSTDTRNRIIAIAKEVGYTPSLVARGLVTQRSYCVGLVVPTFADPFHSQVAQGIEEEARRHKYSLFLASTEVNAQRELEVARSFHGRQVDGIIVSSSWVGNDFASVIEETGIPMTFINNMANSDNLYTVDHDDYSAGRQLVEHLVTRGYQRIAFLGDERGGRALNMRKQAWIEVLQAFGLEPELVVYGPDSSIDGGIAGATQLLGRADALWGTPPDAIFCYNDTMAVGTMSVLRRQKLRIPDDVAVCGVDDLDIASVSEPPLTTIHQPRRAMGVRAMQILLALMEHETDYSLDAFAQHTYVPGELIIREST